jgi:CMP-N,N'-diacetyllegionaminic acid synthase
MIGGRLVLGVIAARGGSKGLPRKNVLPLSGKPLVAWSVAAAADSRLLDRTVVSTDDAEIAEAARKYGGDVPFMRPGKLATDEASIVDVVLHAVDNVGDSYGYVVLLQATSPLRTASDIDGAIELCRRSGAPSCVSVVRVTKGPGWMYVVDDARRLRPIADAGPKAARRQDLPEIFMPNGAVYVAELSWLRETRNFYGEQTIAYEMPIERSPDIDTVVDLKLAAALLADTNGADA